jgi:hypothetical protein
MIILALNRRTYEVLIKAARLPEEGIADLRKFQQEVGI